jgi:hypothetical protein
MKTAELCKSKIEILLASDHPIDRFVGALGTMNMDCVDAMIGDLEQCNKTTKYEFYSQLTELYDQSKKAGDHYFRIYSAHYTSLLSPSPDLKAFCFMGNFTGNYFSLGFKTENKKIISFSEWEHTACPVAKKQGARLLVLTRAPF